METAGTPNDELDADTHQVTNPERPHKRRARRLRIAGVSVLALGLVTAGLVYRLGMRNAELNNAPSMLGFNRAEQRQMGQLYGKSGQMVDDWIDDLEQPRTQALLIVTVSALIAASCFYFARLARIENKLAGTSRN